MSSAARAQTVAAAALDQQQVALQSIAHELRQPLSAIESIAYYLSLVLPRDDERLREQVGRLQQLVEQSNWILTSGLDMADKTPPSPQPLDLEEVIIHEAAAWTSQGNPQPQLALTGGLPLVRLDPGRGPALIKNLLALFQQISGSAYPVRMQTSATPMGVCLLITTPAQGYRSESSLGPGSSLSIASARRVVTAHGGTFALDVDAVSGIRLLVVLP
jgi:two-component system OmpR family sensor kinase